MYLVPVYLIEMLYHFSEKSKALNVATNAGFRGMQSNVKYPNVLPMFYLKNENPRKLHACKGFKGTLVIPEGFKPPTF